MMRRTSSLMFAGLLLLGFAVPACGDKKSAGQQEIAEQGALGIGSHECASCGMLVREQPAPHGQLIHRDGTREFFCSLSDMLTYLDAPSPHGKAVSLFVESMDERAPEGPETKEDLPWLDATLATYVVGIERAMVMGTPILSYSSRERAMASAKRNTGIAVSWAELRPAIAAQENRDK